ncbi:MAG: hypothetical protein ACRYFX_21985 [Janthinobacterium lividum]
MKIAATLLLIISPVVLHAQDTPASNQESTPNATCLDFASVEDGCSEGRRLAEKDIKEKKPCLLLAGGIAPVVYATDKNFELEFGVRYLENGCTGPNAACAAAYDTRIFQYLTENFGGAWRKKIRKDVLAFEEWKRKN